MIFKKMFKKAFFILAFSTVLTNNALAETYAIDADHSRIGFKIRHLAISNVAGNFGSFTGKIDYDAKKLESSKAEASLAVESVNTGNKKRDDHLRGEDFFATTKFPNIKFVSQKVEPSGKDAFKLTGDLTIRDQKRPVIMDVVFQGKAKDPYGNERVSFLATTKLNRKDFGLKWNKVIETGSLVVGDEVQIEIEIEGIKKKLV
jgi:polyisoprenoid-binding protein YceI